jgi:hypothetical protein
MKKSELLKLIVDLEKRVRDLENRKQYDPFQPIGPGRLEEVRLPSVWNSPCKFSGCTYPLIWHGTVPPPCTVCGQPAPTYTVTCTSATNEPEPCCGKKDPCCTSDD